MEKVNLPLESMLNLVREMVKEIPEEMQDAAQSQVLRAIALVYSRYGVSAPDWLRTVLGGGVCA